MSELVEQRGGDIEDVFAAVTHDGVESLELDLELVALSPDAAAEAFARRYAELDARR